MRLAPEVAPFGPSFGRKPQCKGCTGRAPWGRKGHSGPFLLCKHADFEGIGPFQ